MTADALIAIVGSFLSGAGVALAVSLFKLGSTLGQLTEAVDNLTSNDEKMDRRISRLERRMRARQQVTASQFMVQGDG